MTAVIGVTPGDAQRMASASAPPTGRVRRFVRLLAAERIKLLSTRSPWWCGAIVVALLVGLTALAASFIEPGDGSPWWSISGIGTLPTAVVAALGALAATGEYRTGTVRTTFLAAPGRVCPLVAKAVVLAVAAAVLGWIASFAAWGLARVVAPQADLALAGSAQWRAVAGVGAVYAVVAVLAVAVGIALRHTGGAITLLMAWIFAGEPVLATLPRVGTDIAIWLPMRNLTRFLVVGVAEPDPTRSFFGEREYLGPWAALGCSAAVALVLLAIAIGVSRRRDA